PTRTTNGSSRTKRQLHTYTAFFLFYSLDNHRDLNSFPTRRSSDLRTVFVPRRELRAAPIAAEALSHRALPDAVGLPGDSKLVRRSEEHTSELQSRGHLVCRLLLEKKNAASWLLHALLRVFAMRMID